MLISREAAVPDREDSAGRWSLDHLFLDQDGIPTLVEVKRSSDTRIRREVVGQTLDYAANGVTYWPVETLRSSFETAYDDHRERIARLLGEDADDSDDVNVDTFWQTVKTNLRAGKIRMLFVADSIPRELARIVEFLNEQMDPAEILAVAIRRYVGGRPPNPGSASHGTHRTSRDAEEYGRLTADPPMGCRVVSRGTRNTIQPRRSGGGREPLRLGRAAATSTPWSMSFFPTATSSYGLLPAWSISAII